MEHQETIDRDKYIEQRYAAAIEYYWAASRSNKRWYKITRALTVIVGAFVTLLASLSSSTLIAESEGWTVFFTIGTPMLAAVLTITAGFSQSFQWGSTWQNMVLTAQQLQSEFDNFLVKSPEERDHISEANKVNNFIMIESTGFFERMLGGAKPTQKENNEINHG